MAYTILIIDDEPMLTDLLSEHLTHHGYRTHTANNSAQALELLRDQPDLIVLDLALPDGLKLCQQIHNYGAYPLLLLTDHIPQPSQADGFQADKDSYLTKPFRLCELTAHITAHLPQVPKAAFYAGFQFNRSDQTVFFNAVELSFSKREFDLMEFLITHPNQVFDQKQLYEAVWNCNTKGNSTTVREHIRKIRAKLKTITGRDHIETVWGVGYKWKS